MTATLNIIGGGRVGQTLAHLWHAQGQFTIAQVLCRSQHSAERACDFIGSGQPIANSEQLQAADIWLISTPDQAIAKAVEAIAKRQLLRADNLVFHCSGALPAKILSPLKAQGAAIASIHPVHNFANPQGSVSSFAKSVCAYEGDAEALQQLLPAFSALDAQLLAIDGNSKSLYHAGSVIASNYLVSLLDAGLACLEKAGLDRHQASELLAPLVHTTVDNVLQSSAEATLTGPIARGDLPIVEKQYRALVEQLPEQAELYRVLGSKTVEIARRQASANQDKLDQIENLLK